MNYLTRLISAELAANGLRLATDDEAAWDEPTLIGLVRATDAEIPESEDLVSVRREWGRGALAAKSAAARAMARTAETAPSIFTAQMLADIWRDENGPARVAAILATLPEPQRHRLAVDYWLLLRRQGRGATLVEVGMQFELITQWAA